MAAVGKQCSVEALCDKEREVMDVLDRDIDILIDDLSSKGSLRPPFKCERKLRELGRYQ